MCIGVRTRKQGHKVNEHGELQGDICYKDVKMTSALKITKAFWISFLTSAGSSFTWA